MNGFIFLSTSFRPVRFLLIGNDHNLVWGYPQNSLDITVDWISFLILWELVDRSFINKAPARGLERTKP